MAAVKETPRVSTPRKHANVQEMMAHRSDQMKAEGIAQRLCLLRRKELEQKQETEQTHRMAQDLIQRREEHVKRVKEKEEGLRKHRALYNIGAIQKLQNQQTAEFTATEEAETVFDPAEASQCGVYGGSCDDSVLRSPVCLSARSPNSLVKSSPKSPKSPLRNTGATKSSDTHFSRFPTADMMRLGYAQGAMVNRGAGSESHKIRLGSYAFDGSRLWMTPAKGIAAAAPNIEQSPRKEGGAFSRKPPSMEPKELVRQLAKKEKELQDRLDKAKYAHEQAEKDLENTFKSLTAAQISSRRAIREGNY